MTASQSSVDKAHEIVKKWLDFNATALELRDMLVKDIADAIDAATSAATYAASVRTGDAANEGEKDARRKKAVQAARDAGNRYWTNSTANPAAYEAELDAIIAKAQG